ncbi:MAG: M28 family peptidase [Gemmatimonadota bacterium]|nr:M28 family peptidase [Gemmatimonadota bacterium]
MGREAGSEGAVKAARFLAARLAELGLEPAGDSGYFQRLPAERDSAGRAIRPTYNVVAVARGSEPALGATYVGFGAHLDHLGIQRPVNGDSIANGADDDGSGSVALLAIARAWTEMPRRPRRSALFVWHTAEEQGLIGSTHFTTFPTVPLDSVVAMLNADMIGRNAPDLLYLIGPRTDRALNGRIGAVVESANGALPRAFGIDYSYDSQRHPEGLYYRSDHFNYAQRRIPVVFFTTGLHPDYHAVTDEPDRIDYDKLARVATLMYRAGVAVADGAEGQLVRPR